MTISTKEAVITAALSMPEPEAEELAIRDSLRRAGLTDEECTEAMQLMIAAAWLSRFGHTGTTRRVIEKKTPLRVIADIAEQAERTLAQPDPKGLEEAERITTKHALRGLERHGEITDATQTAFDAVRDRAVAQMEAGLRATRIAADKRAMAENLGLNVRMRERAAGRAGKVLEWVLHTERLWIEESWTDADVAGRIKDAEAARAESLMAIEQGGGATVRTGCRYLLAETSKQAGEAHRATGAETAATGLATAVCAAALENSPRS